MQALVWVDPGVLALVWAHAMVVTTRLPAGEIDRGTVDILLGLPVTRRAVFIAESVAWLLSGAVVIALGWTGHRLVIMASSSDMHPTFMNSVRVAVTLYGLYVAAGGIGFLISAVSDRRGRAVAALFGVILASYLLSFLAQFWTPAKSLGFLSLMHYYQPMPIFQQGTWPLTSMLTLLGIGVAAWIAGCELFARRSIATT